MLEQVQDFRVSPLKLPFPNIHVTIVDSLNKRIHFLEHLAETLNLEHVRFIHDRAETFGQLKEHREAYDIVTARAVARMSVLSELCLPLVKIGGTFIAMKGAKWKGRTSGWEKGNYFIRWYSKGILFLFTAI